MSSSKNTLSRDSFRQVVPKNPHFKIPEPENTYTPSSFLTERRKRVEADHKRKGFSYVPIDYHARRTEESEQGNLWLQAHYGKQAIRHELISLMRCYIRPGDEIFEGADGKIDKNVRSCLVALLQTTIADPADILAGPDVAKNSRISEKKLNSLPVSSSQCQYRIGKYPAIIPTYTRDDMGNVVDGKINGTVDRYWLEDTKENREKLLAEFGPIVRQGFTVGVATQHGKLNGESHPVGYGFQRYWMEHENIEELVEAARLGYMKGPETGGIDLYRQWKLHRKTLIKEGVSEGELSKLKPDEIAEIIKKADSGSSSSKKKKQHELS